MFLKAALLDDNKEQLLKNQQLLEQLRLSVVLACTNSQAFLNDVKTVQPEILFFDLNLGDSYMTDMEVAFELRLPVLFVSSNTAQYIKEMERLKRDFDVCVDHLTKPFSDAEFFKNHRTLLERSTFF